MFNIFKKSFIYAVFVSFHISHLFYFKFKIAYILLLFWTRKIKLSSFMPTHGKITISMPNLLLRIASIINLKLYTKP